MSKSSSGLFNKSSGSSGGDSSSSIRERASEILAGDPRIKTPASQFTANDVREFGHSAGYEPSVAVKVFDSKKVDIDTAKAQTAMLARMTVQDYIDVCNRCNLTVSKVEKSTRKGSSATAWNIRIEGKPGCRIQNILIHHQKGTHQTGYVKVSQTEGGNVKFIDDSPDGYNSRGEKNVTTLFSK